MIDFIKRLFGFSAKPVEAESANQTAPYKVPEPAATTPIPFIPAGTEASVAAPAPVKKAPAKAKAPAKPKAPAATKAKAPAKPRAPKAKPTVA